MLVRILVKIAWEQLLAMFIVVLSWVTPQIRGLTLLTNGDGVSFKDNPKYLYLRMLHDSEYSPFWVTRSTDLYHDMIGKGLPVLLTGTARYIRLTTRAEYVVCDDNVNPILFDSLLWPYGRYSKILTWHGTGFKKIGLKGDKYHRNWRVSTRLKYLLQKQRYSCYDAIISSSKYDRDRKADCFSNSNVYVTGMPRNEVFFQEINAPRLKRKYELEQFNRIILYAPTYRESETGEPSSPFTTAFLQKLQRVLSIDDTIFIVKRHRKDETFILPCHFDNIRDYSEVVDDLQELLLIADVLVTDYSSVATDYFLTGNPVIFYTYDYHDYVDLSRSFYGYFPAMIPGPMICSEADLLAHIRDSGWSQSARYQREYSRCKRIYHEYEDGRYCDRVIEDIFR